MALPSPQTPIYTIKVPSTQEDYKFRPFLVREEKALLMARQSEDEKVMIDTLKAIIEGCAKSKVDIDKLATFDLEYIFSQIRAKSVGEIVDLMFWCDTCEDDRAAVRLSIDVSKIEVEFNPDHKKKIELFDDVGVVMKYPGIDTIIKLGTLQEDNPDQIIDVMATCIDMIYQGEEVHYAKDTPKAELVEFINNLTADQFKSIQSFFETMPKYHHRVEYKCPVCSKEHIRMLTGISSFF